MAKRPKNAVVSREPSTKKRPALKDPQSSKDSRLRFRFDRVDVEGPWCLSTIEDAHHRDLLRKLRDFEGMTVFEAFSASQEPGKDYPLTSITKEARERLEAIEADDEDVVSRLRLTGKRRLYGFRRGNEFSILWWDAEHVVCPSIKKHT